MFVVVLPLLTAGVLAAAATAARYISPALPRSVSVPLLLLSIPTLANPFWGTLGSQLWNAASSSELSLGQMIGEYGLWGILSNEGPNVGADFVILASLAGIAAAPIVGMDDCRPSSSAPPSWSRRPPAWRSSPVLR